VYQQSVAFVQKCIFAYI